jgi:DNA-binding beta-propeller fold protein YncE
MHRTRSTTLRLAVLALAALGAACAHAPPRSDVVWPDPPETPRIKFVTALRSEEDVDTGNWSRLIRSVSGNRNGNMLSGPMGLALSQDGQRLYVADLPTGLVFVADFEKKSFKKLNADDAVASGAFAVALDTSENVYVTNPAAKRLDVYSRSGSKLGSISGDMERPTGVAVDEKHGLLYVADGSRNGLDNHRVLVFDLATRRLVREMGRRGAAEGEFSFPTFLTVDPNGTLYVVDSMNFRVQLFDHEGHYLRSFGEAGDSPGSFARMKGVAVDGFGNLYVVESEHAVVQLFNPRFEMLMWFGGRESKLEYFEMPAGIVIDPKTNRIYVAEQRVIPRVNVYQLINTQASDALPGGQQAGPAPVGDNTHAGR